MAQLKGWREIPIGGVIVEGGNAVEYKTGGWRASGPSSARRRASTASNAGSSAPIPASW